MVSELKLTDAYRCYRDSGAVGEVPYADATDGCGALDGLTDQVAGTLPWQSVRYDEDGNVQYRFDGLAATRHTT